MIILILGFVLGGFTLCVLYGVWHEIIHARRFPSDSLPYLLGVCVIWILLLSI